ncbi:MAG: hypothetical protein JWL77_376 [Chthonomonadaceae bacterium]|nr:hypothetical protein [Chthonomonadaceae bacterium]
MHIAQHPLWLAVPLALASGYLYVQVAGSWIIYLNALHPPKSANPVHDFTVDVFVTTYDEPLAMVERALSAAVAMRGAHRTWLLDDGSNPEFRALAQHCGVDYLTRSPRHNAKAGNINAALPRTQGDIIAVFDVDHIPTPDFLEQTVGHFTDPAIGFVQVMLTYSDKNRNWVPQAAAESCLDFYNPTSIGMERLRSTTMMGSNSLLRRSALESIGGYRPGLAEDLATSIALHAEGWRSVYVAKPLAPGEAPPDLAAWFTQQLKWARGVFELLLTAYPRCWSRLTGGQRLGYLVRMTKYLIGPFIGIHLALTLLVLVSKNAAVVNFFQAYLLALLPVLLMDLLIRHTALATWRPPNGISTSVRRAIALVYVTFPIYTVAWVMALLRLPLSFVPTPKVAREGLSPIWRLPLFMAVLILGGAMAVALNNPHRSAVVCAFSALQSIPILVLLWQSIVNRQWPRRQTPETNPVGPA